MSRDVPPTLAEVVAKHRWSGQPLQVWHTACMGCSWTGDTRNTQKTGIALHAEHVESRILALFVEEHGYQLEEYAEPDDPDEPHAWYPATDPPAKRPVTHRRWVSSWERVQ